jgi:hypothetical protein
MFLSYGHEDGVDHDEVALALVPRVATNLFSWEACGPCLLWAKLLQEKGLHSWVIVAYAHTTANPNDIAKYRFYGTFLNLVVTILACDVMLILGDFNVQIGCDFSN